MEISNKPVVQKIIQECINHGIKHIVFSPGSRNAPFAISFDVHPDFETHVIHDERAAAFYALGMSQTLQQTVALCCTSGSAVLNYFPAISEAFYREQRLLILSADRPKRLINKGHGQTIMQHEVFGKHVKQSLSVEDSNGKMNHNSITDFFGKMQESPYRPMHLNIHLEEPLYGVSDIHIQKEKANKKEEIKEKVFSLTKDEIQSFGDQKILVLCGQGSTDYILKSALVDFNKNSNVVVLNENTSGISDRSFVNCIDRALNSIDAKGEKRFVPDILITIGGAIVSKRIKSFFIKHPPKRHIAINKSNIGIDLFLRLDDHYECKPTSFFELLNKKATLLNNKNFKATWNQLDYLVKDRIPSFFNKAQTNTDLEVFHALYHTLPEKCTLHLGNSAIVRYMQLFDPVPNVHYECNRGTSGIDGCTSTAVGGAIANPNAQHVFISGDVSFIYDSNALWIDPFPKNLKIIVLDNKGGGIFKIIDGSKSSDQLERYFEAKHGTDVKAIANSFGIQVYSGKKSKKIQDQIIDFFQDNKSQLLLLTTDSNENPKELERFFKHLNNA
tara:strand:- start:1713 stop:3386 length:1674 start_codon:yes stop_codon:yes gene_type:complete